MNSGVISSFSAEEKAIYSLISSRDGIKAKEMASVLRIPRTDINHWLFSSALMHELCFQDNAYQWHALIRQGRVHAGLYEFSGWYGTAEEFMSQSDDEWLCSLKQGCARIGRNLNNTRGLFHSFTDCRLVIRRLLEDLDQMVGPSCKDWELVFELRLNRSRMIRIYADALVITQNQVFSLEFKMKNTADPDEIVQAAKYVPFLELIFGGCYDVIPALVLTGASDLFEYVSVQGTEGVLPAVSGDMLFNVFNDYMGFLD